MFIISLTYKKSTEEADKHMAAHMEWLKAHYADGTFVASGRKVPRTGGVILARGERAAIEALCAKDPFVIHEIADIDIAEVNFTTTAEGFEGLKG
ncbi:YciI family protein [Rhizobium sp. C1]|uniref:YciI family protein n=1 Tax=Rhizobium sp. C1 TaxID=1349799 RepID=UPI001E47E723|nr:YciI family protein [Rhizobium sp. C1]MCD2179996.1 YciI family protein [Rhizobium sp. C1]